MATRRIPDSDLARLMALLRRGDVKLGIDMLTAMRRAPTVGPRCLRRPSPEGQGETPEKFRPGDLFDCELTGCKGVTVRECVRRQIVSERQRTNDTWRGQCSAYPHCQTEKCEQGKRHREGISEAVEFHGEGHGKRREKRRYLGKPSLDDSAQPVPAADKG